MFLYAGLSEKNVTDEQMSVSNRDNASGSKPICMYIHVPFLLFSMWTASGGPAAFVDTPQMTV